MSIQFSGPKTDFIPITFAHLDPLDRTRQIFEYPSTYNLDDYAVFYIYYNGAIKTISKTSLYKLMYVNKFRITLTDFSSGTGQVFKLLGDRTNTSGIDFVDKVGQTGVIYVYDSIEVTNDSGYNRLTNVYVLSENLAFGFLNPYPVRYSHVMYASGSPSYSLGVVVPQGIAYNLVGFFNNTYIGSTNTGGWLPNSFTSSKAGLVEVIALGLLEFSLSMAGPWVSILQIPLLDKKETKRVYVRCGQTISGLLRALNCIKIIATEVI